jgi:glucose/arabinose dehydrogenase
MQWLHSLSLSVMARALAVIASVPSWMGATASAQDAVAVEIGTFVKPVYIAVAPGEPSLLFIVEQRGRIQVLRDEQLEPQAFLNIQDIVRGPPDANAGNSQGLLSMAFAPDYESSGRFYVAFTNSDRALEINEFLRSASPTRADESSRRVLLTVPHPPPKNHNGGQLQFDGDGYLYISTGDGGNLEPPGEPARDLNSLLGKILRIDPLPGRKRQYRIPRSNPFRHGGGLPEIFAYGLRHPWRFSIDGRRIAIADVGEHMQEEVNLLDLRDASGANFGWPQYEGNLLFDNDRPGPHPPTFPIFTYDHTNGRCSIIGGYVVRDPNLPTLLGRYIYGDACTGEIRTFRPRVNAQEAVGDRSTGVSLPGVSGFGLGFNGKLYAAQITGQVWRLEPP